MAVQITDERGRQRVSGSSVVTDTQFAPGRTSSVPVVGLARWVHDGYIWEVRLGLVWFDAPQRKMELVWQVGDQGEVYHYTGEHWTARERFYVCPAEAPYTDIGLDMMALGEVIMANLSAVQPVAGTDILGPPPAYGLYTDGRGFGVRWALFFLHLPHWLPLMRAGWFWRPGPDGLEKSWHLTL